MVYLSNQGLKSLLGSQLQCELLFFISSYLAKRVIFLLPTNDLNKTNNSHPRLKQNRFSFDKVKLENAFSFPFKLIHQKRVWTVGVPNWNTRPQKHTKKTRKTAVHAKQLTAIRLCVRCDQESVFSATLCHTHLRKNLDIATE